MASRSSLLLLLLPLLAVLLARACAAGGGLACGGAWLAAVPLAAARLAATRLAAARSQGVLYLPRQRQGPLGNVVSRLATTWSGGKPRDETWEYGRAQGAAEAAEDDAEVKLDAALRAIESSAAGPSGAVKQE